MCSKCSGVWKYSFTWTISKTTHIFHHAALICHGGSRESNENKDAGQRFHFYWISQGAVLHLFVLKWSQLAATFKNSLRVQWLYQKCGKASLVCWARGPLADAFTATDSHDAFTATDSHDVSQPQIHATITAAIFGDMYCDHVVHDWSFRGSRCAHSPIGQCTLLLTIDSTFAITAP